MKTEVLSSETIGAFLVSLNIRGRSAHTEKAYSADLRMFLSQTNYLEIRVEEFENLAMNWLTAYRRIVSVRTTNRRLTSLRSYAKWALWGISLDEYSPPNPGPAVPHPLPEGIAGVRRMITATQDEQQRALVVLCGMLGLRISEALSVDASCFDVQARTATIRGKGDKTRVLPVSVEALDHLIFPLTRALVGDGPIVQMDDRFARNSITRLGIQAGLMRRVTSHDLRATFATETYERTKDQRLVQMLLGHASGKTTEGYISVSMDKMRAAVELL